MHARHGHHVFGKEQNSTFIEGMAVFLVEAKAICESFSILIFQAQSEDHIHSPNLTKCSK